MLYLYEKTYPEIGNNLIAHDFQLELVKKFKATFPELWEKVIEFQKGFSSQYRSLTCVTVFFKETKDALGEVLNEENFDFSGKHCTVSNNTSSTCDSELDIVYNNIFVTVIP